MTPAEIEEQKKSVESGRRHPLEVKKGLARRLVADFHGEQKAEQALKDFEAQFQQKALPSDLPLRLYDSTAPQKLYRLLAELTLAESNTEAQRKIKEGAVYMSVGELDEPQWQRLTDPAWEFDPRKYPAVVFRVGRRLLRVAFHS
jgi:tyrosyl-tRNA synthetase